METEFVHQTNHGIRAGGGSKLFIALLAVSALTWPVMKIGSNAFSPLWFTALRLAVATAALLVLLAMMRAIALPKKADMKAIFVIGTFQMALFLIFAHIGIEHIHASQANILCYATSLFVVPLGLIVFGENPTRMGWLGVLCSLSGVLLLFSPWNYDWHHATAWAASGLLLLSAACWSVAILFVRHGQWQTPLLTLQLWQAAFATVICLTIALLVEGPPRFAHTPTAWGVLLFTGVASGAFGQWAMTHIQRDVHPIKVSAGYLLIPVVTLVLCFFLLGESLSWVKVGATALILGGSGLCLLGESTRPGTSAPDNRRISNPRA